MTLNRPPQFRVHMHSRAQESEFSHAKVADGKHSPPYEAGFGQYASMSGRPLVTCAESLAKRITNPRLLPPVTLMTTKYWLLKAEPDSRIVKGKDVKVILSCIISQARSINPEVVWRR
jgi:hypothetical protein